MITFLVRRFLQAIPTLLLSSLLIFFVISLAPGDFLTMIKLNPNISPEQVDNLSRNFGLDRPAWEQYLLWMKNIFLHGDFGISFQYQQPVLQVMLPRILNSLWLVLLLTILLYGLAIPLGVYGAIKQNSFFDRSVNLIMYFLLGFPSFFLALIALYFIVELRSISGWDIPIGGMTSSEYASMSSLEKVVDVAKHLIIPAFLVAVQNVATLSRYLRAQMLEVMHSDYVRTARAKGVSEGSAVWKHTFRNAIVPIAAGIGAELPTLIGGAGFIEVVFAYPGITPMLLDSLQSQDLYLIAGFTMLTSVLLIIGNALSDVLLTFIDPRIRME